jgi:hypothetical protein
MVKIVLGLVITLSLLSTGHASSVSAMDQARQSYAKGDHKNTIEYLSNISKDNPDFLQALTNLHKYHYKNNQWAKFFGHLMFYRILYLNPYDIKQEFLIPELIILEALALNKHCRWKQALSTLLDLKEKCKQLGVKFPVEAVEAETFIIASLRTNGFKTSKSETLPAVSPMTKDGYWRIKKQQLQKLDNPKHLRMNVRSQCKD